MDKRKDSPASEGGALVKRQKQDDTSTSAAVTIQTKGASGALVQTVRIVEALANVASGHENQDPWWQPKAWSPMT